MNITSCIFLIVVVDDVAPVASGLKCNDNRSHDVDTVQANCTLVKIASMLCSNL